jgi:tetratricopeptide (TPR) repeat protein
LERPHLSVPTSVVPALNDLAEAYMAQGKVAEAEASLRRALTLIDAHPEQIDDPLLLTSLDDYAGLLKRSGRVAEAEKLAMRANAVRARNSDSVPVP